MLEPAEWISLGGLNASADLTSLITTDHLALTWAERRWSAWYVYMNNDVLATGIFLLVLHETAYLGQALFWYLGKLEWMQKYKIQDNRVVSPELEAKCLRHVLLSHAFVEAPLILFFHPVVQYFGVSTEVPFPPIQTMAIQILGFFILEDTWHYWSHRALHTPWLYKNVHKKHHELSTPFGLGASYSSPAEILVLGLGTIGPPILLAAAGGNLHTVTVFVWVVLRVTQAIESHSGYDLPWGLSTLFPFWAGADWHDRHHEKFLGNYSSSFRWWDILFNTCCSHRVVQNGKNPAKASDSVKPLQPASTRILQGWW